MAGRGPAPKTARRNKSDVPLRGEWRATPGIGWQHGPAPGPPADLLESSKEAWTAWMRSWFAAHWTPEDLPGLLLLIGFYDQCLRAQADPFIEVITDKGVSMIRRPSPATETRQLMDNYGITPKGQQDRRWMRPEQAPAAKPGRAANPYGHLRVAK